MESQNSKPSRLFRRFSSGKAPFVTLLTILTLATSLGGLVETAAAVPGAEPLLAAGVASTPITAITVGAQVKVVYAGSDGLNLRRTPGYIGHPASDIAATLYLNDIAVVVGGPRNKDGLVWWNVASPRGGGWVAERSASGRQLIQAITGSKPPVLRQSDVSVDYLREISYPTGGAEDCTWLIISSCARAGSGRLKLVYQGAHRISALGDAEYLWCPGTNCTQDLQVGDMVYFAAQGVRRGETVRMVVVGPNGRTWGSSSVVQDSWYGRGFDDDPDSPHADEARFIWTVPPGIPRGSYRLRVIGNSGAAEMRVRAGPATAPTFGVGLQDGLHGSDFLPIHGSLRAGTAVMVSYGGFKAGQDVRTALYVMDGRDGALVHAWSLKANRQGEAEALIHLPVSLTPGYYALVVPETIPDLDALPYPSMASAESAVMFEIVR